MLVFFFFGIVLGYLSGTLTESFGHKYFGHPRAWQRRLYHAHPEIFNAFLKPLYQHLVIHHGKTYQSDIFRQFASDFDKQKVDRWIEEKFSKDYAQLIWLERYNLTLRGMAGILPFALPFTLGPALIFYFFGLWAFWGSLMTAFLPVWCSKYVHPLIHRPEETALAPWHAQWFMQSKLGRWAFKNHYLHHRFPEYNFNLLPGGDYLLGLHKPTPEELKPALEKALADFHRRMDPSRQSAIAPAVDLLEEKNSYLSLGNPDFSQRFRMQATIGKWKANHTDSQELREDLREAQKDYGYIPEDHSNPSSSSWWSQPEFFKSAYQVNGEGNVVFRGTEFSIGDVLATNRESDSDGLYSSLSCQLINFAHVGLIVELEKDGELLPSVLEMSRLGVRAVPLRVALARPMITYAEVYRHRRPITRTQKKRIVEVSKKFLEQTFAFDLRQDFSDISVLTCAKLVSRVFEEVGLEQPCSRTKYHPQTAPNLRRLGIEECLHRPMIMPDDFAKSSQFQIVGLVDNGSYEKMVARLLSRTQFQKIWRERTLHPRRYPFRYYFNRWIVSQVQNNGLMANFILKKVLRTKKELFPSGPLEFLSLALFGDRCLATMTRNIERDLATMKPEWVYKDWEEVSANLEISALVANADSKWRSFFESRPRWELLIRHSA